MCCCCPMRFFKKEREFAMWICNNGQKVITGTLKDLLIESGHNIAYDLSYRHDSHVIDLRKPKCIDNIIQVMKEDGRINASLNHVFEKLSPFEKTYAVHYVLSHLFNRKNKPQDLCLWMEATIDVLFEVIKTRVAIELDGELDEERPFYTRKLIVKACKEIFDEEDQKEDDLCKKDSYKINDFDFWSSYIDVLSEQILFDNDFDLVEVLENPEKIQDVEISNTFEADFFVEGCEKIQDVEIIELAGQHLPPMRFKKKDIAKMIKDILKMK